MKKHFLNKKNVTKPQKFVTKEHISNFKLEFIKNKLVVLFGKQFPKNIKRKQVS